MIMEYASSEEAAEEIIQEGFSDAMKNFGRDVMGSGNQESIIKKILLIIPRFFKAIFTRIKSALSKIRKPSKKDKDVQKQVQQMTEETNLKAVVPDKDGPLTEAEANKIVLYLCDNTAERNQKRAERQAAAQKKLDNSAKGGFLAVLRLDRIGKLKRAKF